MPTAEQIADLTPIVTVAAEAVWNAVAPGEDPPTLHHSTAVARAVLLALIGHETQPGPLDRYKLRTITIPSTGQAVIVWHCPRTDHDGGQPDGHVGIIARDLDCDQSGLTLGEILAAVLSHERDEHDGPAI